MSTTFLPSEDTRISEGLDELRAGTLPLLVAALVIGAWVATVAAFQTAPVTILVWPFALGVLGFGSYRLVSRSLRLASLVLVGGLTGAEFIATWLYPNSLVACLLAPLVLVAGLLLGPGSGVAVAVIGSGALWLGQSHLGHLLSTDTLVMASVLVWATALLAWLMSRSVYTALAWAWHSYAQAREAMAELRLRQGELNRALKSLNHAYDRLEQVNAELERARAAAQEAHRLKAEFAATISHELRTPLNLIIGFSEMMATAPHTYDGETLPPGYQCDVDAIYRNARHLSNLIDDILDLGQIEAGRMALVREPANLITVVDEAVDAVRALFESKGVELAIDLPVEIPSLLIDPTRIRQVFINLLTNAARFTERGKVTVRASVEPGQVIIAVKDTGSGIAPEDLAKVFEEFRQVDGTIRRRYGGSGLGLAISKEFVELHGGSIWAESSPGEGSTFSFSLPRQENVVSVPSRHTWETWVHPGIGQAEAKPVLAVVDDGSDGAKTLLRHLGGWRTVAVRDAGDVRRLVRATPVRAVVSTASTHGNRELLRSWRLPSSTLAISCPLSGRRDLRAELKVFDYLEKPVLGTQVRTALKKLPPLRSVLIVDDDPEMVRLLGRMVRASAKHARILGSYGGSEALAALREQRPDLVLLDLLMPGIDGFTVLERMRSDQRMVDIPVIVVTARGDQTETLVATSFQIGRAEGMSIMELTRCLQGCLSVLVGSAVPSAPGLPEVIAD